MNKFRLMPLIAAPFRLNNRSLSLSQFKSYNRFVNPITRNTQYFSTSRTISNLINSARSIKSTKTPNRPNFIKAKRPYASGAAIVGTLSNPFFFALGSSVILFYGLPYLFQKTPLKVFYKLPANLVYAIAALNVIVFFAWKNPSLYPMLYKYFLLQSPFISANFNLLQMFGATFSHKEVWHLVMNMLTFASFGTTLATIIGPANFLTVYLLSGVWGSFFSIALPVLMKSSIAFASLGASGAVFGILGCFSYFFPYSGISVFFVPVPGGAWVAFLLSCAGNFAGLFFKWGSLDYAAHLGGSAIGVIGAWYLKNIKRRKA